MLSRRKRSSSHSSSGCGPWWRARFAPDEETAIRRPPLTFNAWLRYGLIRRAFARVPRSGSVLEIGAGLGAVSARLAERFAYTGVEADEEAASVAAGRVQAHGGVLVRGDAASDAPEGPFDAVCAFEVLEHIEDDSAALADWFRRLRPGGTLVLSVPAHQHRFGPWDTAVGHYRRYDRPHLQALLRDAGFVDMRVGQYGFPLGYVLEVVRHRIAAARGEGTQQPEEATASSGRTLQPSAAFGLLTWMGTLPFRLIQRPFVRSNLGTGIVASATRPEA